ncbi:TPA: hypothetical protein TZC25_001067 [Streptococcus suis]|nr:hypothetical protein [Streptococcus suis]
MVKNFEIISTILIFLAVTLLSYAQNQFFNGLENPINILNEDFLNIYSFVCTVLSLFGIYFAFIQFSIQNKNEKNTYFGINYVSYVLNGSLIFNLSKSISFFTLGGILVFANTL